jgi:hypothetical protein
MFGLFKSKPKSQWVLQPGLEELGQDSRLLWGYKAKWLKDGVLCEEIYWFPTKKPVDKAWKFINQV